MDTEMAFIMCNQGQVCKHITTADMQFIIMFASKHAWRQRAVVSQLVLSVHLYSSTPITNLWLPTACSMHHLFTPDAKHATSCKDRHKFAASGLQVKKGDLVYDPFVGTGSILVAAAHFGAHTIGADIDIRVVRDGEQPASSRQFLKQPKKITERNAALHWR